MRRKTIVCVLLVFLLANLLIFAGCNAIEENKGFALTESAIIMSNDILSDKLNAKFSADINKELYDFTGEFNYLFCYEEELDYYAIYNMDSGKIMERSNGNVYSGYLDFKCYYGGYGSYFYQVDNMLYSITDDGSALVDDAMEYFNEYSENLKRSCIDDSEFKSRDEIKTYVEDVLCQDGVVISKCDNRSNAHYIDDGQYSSFTLANNYYADNAQVIQGNKCCVIGNQRIGFDSFMDYDGNWHQDTLFPINWDNTCGLTAATMLLQYYERQGLVRTVSPQLYSRAITSLKFTTYSKLDILSEILQDELIKRHNDILDGSTYTTVKDAINKYFVDYGLTGISATSSASWWGLKSAIDNDDPCIVFVGGCTLYSRNNNLMDCSSVLKLSLTEGHAMYTYGYTTDNVGVVDEYICHMGWHSTNYFYSITYVSKLAIAGNVRLLY